MFAFFARGKKTPKPKVQQQPKPKRKFRHRQILVLRKGEMRPAKLLNPQFKEAEIAFCNAPAAKSLNEKDMDAWKKLALNQMSAARGMFPIKLSIVVAFRSARINYLEGLLAFARQNPKFQGNSAAILQELELQKKELSLLPSKKY